MRGLLPWPGSLDVLELIYRLQTLSGVGVAVLQSAAKIGVSTRSMAVLKFTCLRTFLISQM